MFALGQSQRLIKHSAMVAVLSCCLQPPVAADIGKEEYVHPSVAQRTELFALDRQFKGVKRWAMGRPRDYPYLRKSSTAERAEFAFALGSWLAQQADRPYSRCRQWAGEWWQLHNQTFYELDTESWKEPGSIAETWLHDSLLDGIELYLRFKQNHQPKDELAALLNKLENAKKASQDANAADKGTSATDPEKSTKPAQGEKKVGSKFFAVMGVFQQQQARILERNLIMEEQIIDTRSEPRSLNPLIKH